MVGLVQDSPGPLQQWQPPQGTLSGFACQSPAERYSESHAKGEGQKEV